MMHLDCPIDIVGHGAVVFNLEFDPVSVRVTERYLVGGACCLLSWSVPEEVRDRG